MNEKPLFTLAPVSPRSGLLQQVLFAVQEKQRMSRLWRFRTAVVLGIASIAALVPAGIALADAFATSHFGAYASLVFSDSAVAVSYWKEIGLSLLESLPVMTLAITLALVGLLLYSVRAMVRALHAAPLITNAY
jgi:hypothetical protein